MNDPYYESNETISNSTQQQPVLLSVILSRKTLTHSHQANASVRLAVVARVPRKRSDVDDPVQYSFQYFTFLDDRRRFTNLDALLTRFSPVGVVHLSSIESGEISHNSANKNQQKRAREITSLLHKMSSVIDSRNDILANDGNDADATTTLTHTEPTLPKHISNTTNLTQSLESNLIPLLGGENNARFKQYKNDTKLMDDVLPKQALAYLIHQENIQPESEGGGYELLSGDLTSHLTMDRTAMECINLLPPRHAGISNVVVGGSQGTNSIFGVLNQCKTKMGVRMLEVWLRQPCVDHGTIMYRQNAVAKMVEEDGLGRDRLRDEGLGGLRGVDLDGLCGKLATFMDTANTGGTSKALESLYRLHLFSDSQLPVLMEALSDLASGVGVSDQDGNSADGDDAKKSGALATLYSGLGGVMEQLAKSVQLVEAVLDFDVAPREFLVKASFSEELQEIKEELEQIEQEKEDIHEEMNRVWEDLSGERGQVRLEDTDAVGNTSCVWQFRILDTNASKMLQNELAGDVTVHRLLKNGVYFSNKALRGLGDKKHDLLEDYEKNQRVIVQNAMSIAVTYIPVLERASELIAELDVLASLAHVAAFSPHGYCRPEMTDIDDEGTRSGIELREARHPCVEVQENVDFIPNDFDLVRGESNFLLVTGPNMGGKSTYIRSLGAIIVMAQIGSYIPCTSAKINIVHNLLARVGAGDSQDRGISTFMAEMLETSSIIRTSTSRSLIIIDELGRGTSTFDGYGLARAISEYIVQKIGCTTVFATHFHELTAMEQSEKCVKNCHVTATQASDGSGLSFLYEVRPGPCLESFGIQVAEMANVPAAVIKYAKRKAKELENFDYKRRKSNSPSAFLENFRALRMKSFSTSAEKKNAIMKLLDQQ